MTKYTLELYLDQLDTLRGALIDSIANYATLINTLVQTNGNSNDISHYNRLSREAAQMLNILNGMR